MRDVLPAPEARALVAAIRVYNRDGRCTVRGVAADAGFSLSLTHDLLWRLRDRGLVRWTDGAAGTLTPLVWPVAA